MALVQTPLAAVIAKPGTMFPKDLAGGTAGVTGLPSDVAVLTRSSKARAAIRSPSSRSDRLHAVPSLLAGKVDAVTAF